MTPTSWAFWGGNSGFDCGRRGEHWAGRWEPEPGCEAAIGGLLCTVCHEPSLPTVAVQTPRSRRSLPSVRIHTNPDCQSFIQSIFYAVSSLHAFACRVRGAARGSLYFKYSQSLSTSTSFHSSFFSHPQESKLISPVLVKPGAGTGTEQWRLGTSLESCPCDCRLHKKRQAAKTARASLSLPRKSSLDRCPSSFGPLERVPLRVQSSPTRPCIDTTTFGKNGVP